MLSLKEIADKQNGEQRMKKEREMTLNRLRDYKSVSFSLIERKLALILEFPSEKAKFSWDNKGEITFVPSAYRRWTKIVSS